ncbi:MAG: PD-(D/E)XK nuclease family protein, partial [Clostridia bacterium]|nr:PD-(D/E)XK nuclease family protein [Clostridia bacterium]
YGFRRAMPSIFRNRRESATPYNGVDFPASITLGNNFRSRSQVTESTNFLFRRLMTADTGGIVYDEREELVSSAAFPADGDPSFDTELLVFDKNRNSAGLSVQQAEARVIGERILRMIADGFQVTDKGTLRTATYRDFCILLRSVDKNGPIFSKELQAMGIPVATQNRESFFECAEIRTALSILRAIDNPMLDVPLLATLMSPIYGFSPDNMAAIRSIDRDLPLYSALRRMSASTHPLAARATAFLSVFDRYRTLAASLPADALLHRIYEDTDMLSVMSAKNGGGTRIANLRKLYDMARHFEDRDFRGPTAFIRHLDRLEEQHISINAADNGANGQNAVKIMTIHGSKGLEFPVVFVGRLGSQFNEQNIRNDLLMHAEYGIGLRLRDRDEQQAVNPLHHQAIATAIKRTEHTEALRLLYVAMTRPKDKLILVSGLSGTLESALNTIRIASPEGSLSTSFIIRASHMSDWILAVLLDHEVGTVLDDAAQSTATLSKQANGLIVSAVKISDEPTVAESANDIEEVPELIGAKERLQYRYPYAALGNIAAKLTASQAAHGIGTSTAVHLSKPAFLSRHRLTPAQRGTATHLFLEHVSLGSVLTAEEQANAMVENGIMTAQQKDALRLDRLQRFLQSETAKRMAASPMMLRELAFAVERPLSAFGIATDDLPADAANETILVQGIADAVFEEDGELVIVDYKTDRVANGGELVARYRAQLDIYKDALSQTLQRPVKKALLYSFHLNEAFEV